MNLVEPFRLNLVAANSRYLVYTTARKGKFHREAQRSLALYFKH